MTTLDRDKGKNTTFTPEETKRRFEAALRGGSARRPPAQGKCDSEGVQAATEKGARAEERLEWQF
jgi:hypothetical protein